VVLSVTAQKPDTIDTSILQYFSKTIDKVSTFVDDLKLNQ
jgi:hypothetical protein